MHVYDNHTLFKCSSPLTLAMMWKNHTYEGLGIWHMTTLDGVCTHVLDEDDKHELFAILACAYVESVLPNQTA